MIVAIVAVGVLGLLAVVANGVAETRIVTVRSESTAARRPPVPGRAVVDEPTEYLGRHWR